MSKKKLTKKELELLNSKVGLKTLFNQEQLDIPLALVRVRYDYELRKLQEELIKVQEWVIENEQKIVIIFEGRDVAGKGGAIRRITEHINPRHFRTVALDVPTVDEEKQWFFQRYINYLPKPGQMVFFDRSWYNRAVVEPVNGYCTKEEYKIFMGQVNGFEKMLIESNTYLIKFYFEITKEEQARRFEEMKSDPLKKWKLSPTDKKAQNLWDEYTKYEKKMLAETSTKRAPWVVIDANVTYPARLKAIKHILKVIPYKNGKVKNGKVKNGKSK
ncbi:MAG: polyphosphate kinase 2 [Bacteroidia bacterium]|nr:polyphosphate kinase 2 [Bacteroidia bacterium]